MIKSIKTTEVSFKLGGEQCIQITNYRLVNAPLGCLLGLQNVKKYKKMARNEVTQWQGP
ncbi:MAG: hypothetical protein AB1422_10215 [bacterium]